MPHNGRDKVCRACKKPIDPRHYTKAGECYFHPECYEAWKLQYHYVPICHNWEKR